MQLDTLEDVVECVMNLPEDESRYLITRGMDEVYRLSNRSDGNMWSHYRTARATYELSEALGKQMYEAWPKHSPYRGAPNVRPYGPRTLLGLLKMLNAPGYKAARKFVMDTRADRKVRDQHRTARTLQEQLLKRLKDTREQIDYLRRCKWGIPADLEADVAQLDALAERIMTALIF